MHIIGIILNLITNYFSYFRRKRLKVLLSENTETGMGRHWFLRFLLTTFLAGIFAVCFMYFVESLFPNNVNAKYSLVFLPFWLILSVDLSDWAWGIIYDEVSIVMSGVFAITAFGIVVVAIIALNPWDFLNIRKKVKDWHYNINVQMQNQTINKYKALEVNQGENWFIHHNDQGFLVALPYREAKSFCNDHGQGYRLPLKDEIELFNPFPKLDEPLGFWRGDNRITPLNKDKESDLESIEPSTNTQSFFVICFKPKVTL